MAAQGDIKARPAGADSSLGRGLDILLALGSEDATRNGGLGVVRVAGQVGREKSQVSRALKTLAQYGLVDRDAQSLDYRLGWRLFALAAHAGHQHLLEEAPSICRELVARLGETAHLSVRDGAEVLTLMSELSPSAVHVSNWTGRRTPAHCSASGRALLFDHSELLVCQLFPTGSLPVCGPRTPSNVADLWRRIVGAREAGFALSDEEFESGWSARPHQCATSGDRSLPPSTCRGRSSARAQISRLAASWSRTPPTSCPGASDGRPRT